MRRREFITLLGGAAAAWPLLARAQHATVRPVIAMLVPLSAAAATGNVAAFRSALRDIGYVDGRNATLELRYGDGALQGLGSLVNELLEFNPDVLFVGGKAGALAAHSATQLIPIVIVTPEDPTISGLANAIAKPGGNVTGTWLLGDDALGGKRLELLRLAIPTLSRVGIVANPDDPSDALTITRLPHAARALGISVEVLEVRDAAKLDGLSAEAMRTDFRLDQFCRFGNAESDALHSDRLHLGVRPGRKRICDQPAASWRKHHWLSQFRAGHRR